MPSEKIKSWWGNLPKTAKTAFTTAMVAGILTHLFILTNKLFNYNEVSVLFLDEQEMLMGRMAEGRWLVGAAKVYTSPKPARWASILARVRWNPLDTTKIPSE